MANDDPFIGLIPMIDSVKDIVEEVNPNGSGELMPGVENILQQTRTLE